MAGPQEHLDVQELYTRYARAVHRRCLYFLRSEADAMDATHDVFIKVVEHYASFKAEATPLTWLVRIATNHCLNVLRGRKAAWRERYARMVEVDHAARPSDYTRVERAELLLALLYACDADTQRAALYYFVDEMSQEEAARAAQCSVPTLRKRLRRFIAVGRRRLKGVDPEVVFGKAPV